LWNATPELNWSALRERVKEHLEKEGHLEGVNPTTLYQIIDHFAHTGVEYPESPEELNRILNNRLDELGE
jgi:hypothetical protein